MSQADYTIANQSAANVRSEMNTTFAAIATNNSGATEPTTTFAYQWWYDTSTNIFKIRNADDDAWIAVATFNQTTDTVTFVVQDASDTLKGSASFDENDFTVTSGDAAIATRVRYKTGVPGGYVENLGLSLNGGVLSLTGAAEALSATNPGYVVIRDRSALGLFKQYKIIANQTIDESDLTGNLFGLPTGVAYAQDLPFFGYFTINDNEDAPKLMVTRVPHVTVSPASANIGDPSSAAADTQGSFFCGSDITEANYESNPCVLLLSFRARMNGSDQWTIQALDNQDGIGRFQEGVHFSVDSGMFGARTDSIFEDNGGTAPTFSGNKGLSFSIEKSGMIQVSGEGVNVNNTPAGAVGAVVALPYVGQETLSSVQGIGSGTWYDNSISQYIMLFGNLSNSGDALGFKRQGGGGLDNANFATSDQFFCITNYLISLS